ncbi:cupin domain-containing protein [Sphingomonadaceae bacterium G21617-S1]|nr:cupin domain-containing protein [Sphingomonadaceae bacterium G21617-S1]
MDYLKPIDVVVAAIDETGRSVFVEPGEAVTSYVPGAVEAAYVWGTEEVTALPEIGGPLARVSFPPAGGSRLAIICFPPHSAGKIDMRASASTGAVKLGSSPAMHRSDSIDYEIILQGKIDIVLEGGDRRTLRPGSCLVMGGAMHEWENIYDEPCIYAAVLLGVHGVASQDA